MGDRLNKRQPEGCVMDDLALDMTDEKLREVACVACSSEIEEWDLISPGHQEESIQAWLIGFKSARALAVKKASQNEAVVVLSIEVAKRLHDYCSSYQDEGPLGGGWNSQEKMAAEAELLEAITKAESRNA